MVGAGTAAAALATALRQGGFQGSITLLGAESQLPYDRPALSKDFLTGERLPERMSLKSAEYWQKNSVEIRLGVSVVEVDASLHRVRCDDGQWLEYETLVWAAGSQPRKLEVPGAQQCTLVQVREMRDVEQLRRSLEDCRRVLIAGAGFIGLEVAPGLLKLGKQVALVDPASRLLEQKVAPAVSSHIDALHRRHSVQLHLGVQITQVLSADGRVTGVQLSDGQELQCDMMVAAVGTQPVVEPLAQAGARIANGIEVDAYCRTSLPDVFAVGDCAFQENAFAGGARIRLESIQHATDQAKCVARAIIGVVEPYAALPWFWSNQFDMRLQTSGLTMGHDEAIVRGSPETGRFSVAYLRQGRLCAIDCINTPRDFLQAKPLIQAGAMLPPAAIANADRSLSELAEEHGR